MVSLVTHKIAVNDIRWIVFDHLDKLCSGSRRRFNRSKTLSDIRHNPSLSIRTRARASLRDDALHEKMAEDISAFSSDLADRCFYTM